MDKKNPKKIILSIAMLIILIAALGVGSHLIAQEGTDAVTASGKEKHGLLTADTVKASFNQVGGKVISLAAEEGKKVKQGEVLMKLDTTDLDFEIEQLQAKLNSIDVQIAQAQAEINTAKDKVSIKEQQAAVNVELAETKEKNVQNGTRQEDLANQKLAIQSAQQPVEVADESIKAAEQAVTSASDTLSVAKSNYNRMKTLSEEGLLSDAELEKAQHDVDQAAAQLETANVQVETAKKQKEIAESAVEQQQTVLKKMENGATDEELRQAAIGTEQAELALSEAKQAEQEIDNQPYNIDLLTKQKDTIQLQLENLKVKKQRMTLKAPSDGTIKQVVPNEGENVSAGTPVVLIEKNQLYYEVYVNEDQITKYAVGEPVSTYVVSLDETIEGTVELINSAPNYASMRMSGEKGQDDISSFLVRVDVERDAQLLPGMTVEVEINEPAD